MPRVFLRRLSRRFPLDQQHRGLVPLLEQLESRDLPTVMVPFYQSILPTHGVKPASSPGPTGYSPAQISQAYGFSQITFQNGTVTGDGSNTTIAIVDAYDDPNIAGDLTQFDKQFNLPDPTFTKVNQSGGSTMPAADHGWSTEIALDVEWAHAIAPKASILLVEASDSSDANLFTAVQYAASQPGVVAVSMSWGESEYAAQTSYDSYLTTPSKHAGVTFVAASGDSGAPDTYPSGSPNLLSVGGTTLKLDSSNNISSESAWSSSGGGTSTVEGQPTYQNLLAASGTTYRTNPDVAYDANPNTGFPVYDTYNNPLTAPWGQWGGTSDAAPQWAALIAIADQGRALNHLSALDGPTQTLPDLYALSSSDFNDITSGSSNGSPTINAATGYDLVTGRGTPIANRIVSDLVSLPTAPAGLQQGGFEQPSIGTGSSAYEYDPTGSAWTFSGQSGVSGNGSAFTSGNPDAPDGTQVAFLQQFGSFSQTANLAAGTYAVRFSAAQRQNWQSTSQSIEVLVDGTSVGTFKPSGSSYQTYTSSSVTLTAGLHTIEFEGTNPNGGDNTAFVDMAQLTAVSPPSASLQQGGFETPSVGTGSAAYQYDPTGSAWSFTGQSGVTGNNSGFTSGNANAPEGTQVAFLQQFGSFSQSVTFAAGTYDVSLSAAQRGNYQASSQTFEVLIDGTVVGTFTPTSSSYTSFTTNAFTVTKGAHTIEFAGTNPKGGDNTAFVDQVQLNTASTPGATLSEGSFETPSVGTGSSAYQYDPTGSAWSFTGQSGVAGNGSAFTSGNPNAPDGSQVAFLQQSSSFSQSVTFVAGTYDVSFSAAQRENYQASSQTIEVLVDGTSVGTFTPSSSGYSDFTTSHFVVTAGSHTIEFKGTNPNGGDNTAFVDQVQLNTIPTGIRPGLLAATRAHRTAASETATLTPATTATHTQSIPFPILTTATPTTPATNNTAVVSAPVQTFTPQAVVVADQLFSAATERASYQSAGGDVAWLNSADGSDDLSPTNDDAQ